MRRKFKNNILIILSLAIVFYALVLNIVFPPRKSSGNSNKNSEFSEIKKDFLSSISENISTDVSGLEIGYLLGEKSELPDGLEDKMKAVGLSHIIVVSGTHLSIIIMSARRIFEKFSRGAALFFTLGFLIFYVALVGVSPSLVRASFIAIFGLVAWYFGREMEPIRVVLFTLSGCLLINPYFLTNFSFQLSILSYIGVVIVLPISIRYFYGRDRPGFIGSTVLSSLSVMISCLPLQIYYFGSFNLASTISNLLILPTIPIVMGLGFLTGTFGLIGFKVLGVAFGTLNEVILKYQIFIINSVYNHSEFLFEFPKKNLTVLLLYLILFLWLVFLKKREKKKKRERFLKWVELSRKNIWEKGEIMTSQRVLKTKH